MKYEKDPCLICDCNEPDMGCIMPSVDRSYACPLENTTTEFFMPMAKVPTVTHQQKQVTIIKGKPIFYEPAELKAARSKLTAHLGKHVPGKKYTGAVRLTTKWLFPKGKHKDGEWKATKPDTDNLQKLLKDCMTAVGFWTDDALVASEITEKFWAELPGIYIKIEELE